MRTFHFEDLDPFDFEKLYYYILKASGLYEDVRSYGQKGTDGGVDILCVEKDTGLKHFIQCKRETRLTKSELKKIVNKIVDNNISYQGQIIEVVASCELSRKTHEDFEQYAKEKGFSNALFRGAIYLEEKLSHKGYEHVKEIFFGEKDVKKERAIQRITDSKKGEKLVNEILMNRIESDRNTLKQLIANPSLKFKYDEVIVRSIYDTDYPDIKDDSKPSPWFKSYLHDIYDDGIQLHLCYWTYEYIVINPMGEWVLKKDFDEISYDGEVLELNVNILGRVPFYNIVDIKENGDSYFNCPIIFCDFEGITGPFQEYCYEYHDYRTNKRFLFEKDKRAYISEYDFEVLKANLQKYDIHSL